MILWTFWILLAVENLSEWNPLSKNRSRRYWRPTFYGSYGRGKAFCLQSNVADTKSNKPTRNTDKVNATLIDLSLCRNKFDLPITYSFRKIIRGERIIGLYYFELLHVKRLKTFCLVADCNRYANGDWFPFDRSLTSTEAEVISSE